MNQQKELMKGEGKREKEKRKGFAASKRKCLFAGNYFYSCYISAVL